LGIPKIVSTYCEKADTMPDRPQCLVQGQAALGCSPPAETLIGQSQVHVQHKEEGACSAAHRFIQLFQKSIPS